MHSLGALPHTPVLIQWYRFLRFGLFSMRQPINKTSRVPAYLHGRTDGAARGESSSLRLSRVVKEEDVVKIDGFCVEPSNIGEGRDGVDVS